MSATFPPFRNLIEGVSEKYYICPKLIFFWVGGDQEKPFRHLNQCKFLDILILYQCIYMCCNIGIWLQLCM
jgi:hypothetical protein